MTDDHDGQAPDEGRAAEHRIDLAGLYRRDGLTFGVADLFLLAPSRRRLVELAALLSGFKVAETGRSPISSFVYVLPPDSPIDDEAMRAGIGRVLERAQDAPDPGLSPDGARIVVARTRNLEVDTLRATLAECSARAAVVIVDAHRYRAAGVSSHQPAGGAPSMAEDLWAPHLVVAIDVAATTAAERGFYAVVDAGQPPPTRPELIRMLTAHKAVAVIGASRQGDPWAEVTARLPDWQAGVGEGRLGAVLQEIAGLPSAIDAAKPFLRIEFMARAGLGARALDEVRSLLAAEPDLDGDTLSRLARIAVEGGGLDLAQEIVRRAAPLADTREALGALLAMAADLDLQTLAPSLEARIAELFPGAQALALHRIQRDLGEGRYAEAALHFDGANEPESAELYRRLGSATRDDVAPDYVSLRAELRQACPNRWEHLEGALVRDALRRGLVVHAFELVAPGPVGAFAPAQARRLMDVVEGVLLARDKHGELPVDPDRVADAIRGLVRSVAAHPDDGRLRIRLARVVSVDVAGSLGVAFLISAVLHFASAGPQLRVGPPLTGGDMARLLGRRDFLLALQGWIAANGPLTLLNLRPPEELMTEPVEEVFVDIVRTIEVLGADLAVGEDVEALLTWMTMAMLVVPYTSEPQRGLQVLRLTANLLAGAGRAQAARDLIEDVLRSTAGDPERRRMAWFALADVYHRLGHREEGLVGLACCLATDAPQSMEEVYHQAVATSRYMRDLGFFTEAIAALRFSGELLGRMDAGGAWTSRLETLAVQIGFAALVAGEPGAPGLPELLMRACGNAQEVLDLGDEPAPIGVILAQLVRLAEQRGVPVPDAADLVLGQLQERLSGQNAALVSTLRASVPDVADVMALVRLAEPARYAEDVAPEATRLAILARRLLASQAATENPAVAALAIELLADRAVAVPGWLDAATPPPAVGGPDEPGRLAVDLAEQGATLLLAGLDEQGRLTWTTARKGEGLSATMREDDDGFSRAQLRAWSQRFPYAYGVDEDDANRFYTSQAGLTWSDLPYGEVVVVADVALQQLPPNVFLHDGRLAGETRAMSATPSLSWLAAARSRARPSGARHVGWISTSSDHGETLVMAASRLAETFGDHAFEVDNGGAIPGHMAGADIAVVVAHGSIVPEGRYFQIVSDEGRLRTTAANLAAALRNVSVVVLFVCSGGRNDEHPHSNTTVGLARQLLDRGCSVVIGSPWPLDARVTYHWLPTFMDRWSGGGTVASAAFGANRAVAAGLGGLPANCLAMHVFGDGLLTAAG